MKAFFDTSVLLAVFYGNHQFHEPSIELVVGLKKNEACCGVHSLAEIYSSLTGRAGAAKVSGPEAMLFIADVLERLTIVTLDHLEYLKVLEACSAIGIAGGAVYDALLAHCALKVEAQIIYTWNVKDFMRLGPTIATRVKTPSSYLKREPS